MIKKYIITVDEEKKDIMGGMPLMDKPQELVQCKDCKHYDHTRLYKCRIHGSMFQPKDENWFCADGVRK